MRNLHKHFKGCCNRKQTDSASYSHQTHHGPTGFGGGRHGFFEGRHSGFRGGRGGPMRLFGAGDLRFVILQLIADKPSYGYEIIKSIQERLGGSYAPSPGIVYPMLTMLEEMGHATVVTEGVRKLYTITPEGAASLAENKSIVDQIFARIEHVRGEHTNDGSQQIERAISNFRMVIRLKISQPAKLTTEQAHAITDIIDAAAKQIERLG